MNITYNTLETATYAAVYLNTQPMIFNSSLGNYVTLAIVKSPAVSNICFPAGTPVLTDQGIINIDKIDLKKHTIHGETILHITQTITLDKYLISFPPNSIKLNYPTHTTLMSKDHQIMYDGHLVPAYRFLKYSKFIRKVKYSGQVLYNILLSEYSTINVNNLICETLHPNNMIAKLYINNYIGKERNRII
jgi:hypothetical protein